MTITELQEQLDERLARDGITRSDLEIIGYPYGLGIDRVVLRINGDEYCSYDTIGRSGVTDVVWARDRLGETERLIFHAGATVRDDRDTKRLEPYFHSTLRIS